MSPLEINLRDSGAPGVNEAPPARAVAARDMRDAVLSAVLTLRAPAVLVPARDRTVAVVLFLYNKKVEIILLNYFVIRALTSCFTGYYT